jgi:hypothetical protein
MKRHASVTGLAIVAALVVVGVTGCGEREQTALYKDGKYRGKPDGHPWESAPPPYGTASWTPGDQATWENQLRTRQAGQNEYRRIGH